MFERRASWETSPPWGAWQRLLKEEVTSTLVGEDRKQRVFISQRLLFSLLSRFLKHDSTLIIA
jgi:hypothetical protein